VRDRTHAIVLVGLRGAAIFLGTFTLIGLVGELRGRTADVSLWWIDLHDLPPAVRVGLLGVFAGLLLAWAVARTPGIRLRRAAAPACGVFTVLAVRDSIGFYAVAGGGAVHPAMGLPLSLLIALVLGGLAVAAWRTARRDLTPAVGRATRLAVAAGAWAFVFPLAQMLFFGTTDYRRPADVAVIFGARVYADGQPSSLLADRVRTGLELYRSGLVPLLVMSGGDGADGYNEAQVMRDVAIAAGVEPAAVVADPVGTSTEATVTDVMTILAARTDVGHPPRVIAVSQPYHLPRVQLSFANAGLDVFTVPAAAATPISETPLLVLREVPAFWAYFVRVCLG
jgi:vancomycin permeability regulator SanA